MLGIDEVEVRDMVNEPAVDLFGDVRVEAAVASLHVVHGYVHPLGDHRSDGAVGVTEDQYRVGSFGESTSSVRIKVSPSTRPRDDVSTPSTWSGFRIARSLKNTSFSA